MGMTQSITLPLDLDRKLIYWCYSAVVDLGRYLAVLLLLQISDLLLEPGDVIP